jgi:MYXO-CTERM domain-containing protein
MRTITLCRQVWGSLAFVGSLLSLTHPAAAQSCDTDTDCGAGYVCHTERSEGCSGEACKPGVMCPPPTCETYESKYCISAPCSADADCPGGMVCYAPTYSECSGGGATTPSCDKAAAGCDAPAPIDAGMFECHDVTGDATCTPRYQLPCHVDADCGAGFSCEQQRYTVCSGSGMGGSPATDPGKAGAGGDVANGGVAGGGAALDAGPGEVFECHEEQGSNYCRLLELPCDADADCGEGLECQSNAYSGSCGGSTGAGGAAAMGAAGSSDADAKAPVAIDAGTPSCGPESAAPHVCAPHNYYSGGMYPGGGTGTGAGGSYGNPGSESDAGVEQPPTQMGGSAGSGNTSGGSGPGSDDSGNHGHDHHHAHGQHHAGHLPRLGCSVSDGDGSSQLAGWFGLVGMVAFGLRRRARSAV